METNHKEKIIAAIRASAEDFIIPVTPREVKDENINVIEELAAIAGADDEWLKYLLFKIDPRFVKEENNEEELPPDEWVSMREYENWFFKLGNEVPHVLFFLKEWHKRMYTVAGDLMMEGKVQIDIEDKKLHFVFDDEEIDILDKRVLRACKSFVEFCKGKSIETEKYIRMIMGEFKVKFSYDDI